MVDLYGQTLTRREAAERAGALSQFAGVRLMTLGDGVERGIRMLEFRTGTGLRFTALVDRALDIADCEFRGQAIGWHSPAGFRHPSLHEYEGEGGLAWTRSFSGLMLTCGLDHILSGAEVPADTYNYPGRSSVTHSLHGRVSTIPARLTGYGETWEGDACRLWAEGIVQQSTVFGEDLHLLRRIEAEVGGNEIRVTDRVVNQGFCRTPHMFFYHVNVGYPLLDEGARYLAPIRDVLWASHGETYRDQGVGYRTVPAPQTGFREQVWEHETVADTAGETASGPGQRPPGPRLRGGDAQGATPLPLPVAELSARALCAWNRALDAPCAGQPRGTRARRDDLARSRGEPRLRCGLPRARRRRGDRRRRAADRGHRAAAGHGFSTALGQFPSARGKIGKDLRRPA